MNINLEPFMHKIDAKIDKMDDDLIEIKITMARNTLSLEQHMKRTDMLENIVEHNKKALDPIKVDVASIFTVIYFMRWVLGCSAVAATVAAVIKVIN